VRTPDPKQRWLTFVRNHAQVMLACDFFVVVTATFRILYVFVIMEVGTRRILHHNVTANPTAEWTVQQFREALPGGHAYRFLIHDRDSIFSKELDKQVTAMGVRVLRTPVSAPKANSVCERFGGTLRRECLDFLIPFQRASSQVRPEDLDCAFQPRASAYEPWAGDPWCIASATTGERSSPPYSCGSCGSTRCRSRRASS
jgi:hypothetical protein